MCKSITPNDGYHYFFGYYDLKASQGNDHLAHRVEFFDRIDKVLIEIKNTKEVKKERQEKVTISAGNNDITKYINSSEITAIGNTLKNNIEDSIDEYGDSISESEKIKILLEIIKKYM